MSDASNWQQISAFQARVREAERKARHRLKPKTKFKPRRRRARRYSTLAVKAPTVQSAGPIQRVADALGVPVSLMTNPRPDLTAAPEFDEAQRRAALYSTDPNAVLQARVTGRVGAHINAMKAVAYSTQGQVAAMQGLTMVKQRLRRAGLVAVLRRQPPGKLKHFIFHHWRKRSQDKIRRNINQNLAAEYFVNRTLIKYLRWWQFLGHVAVARRMAVRMGNTRIRRKCFRAWKRFVTMQATVAANRDLFRNAAIRELAMKAELSAADRERLFREMWLPQVFANIKAEARCVHAHARLPRHGWGVSCVRLVWLFTRRASRYWRVMRWAAHFRRHRLLYNHFWRWHKRKDRKKAFKNERRIQRRVEQNMEADRAKAAAEAEAAQKAAELAAQKQAEREEAERKERMRKAEE